MISFVTDSHAFDEVVYLHDFMWDLTDLETLVDGIPQLLPIAHRARAVDGDRLPNRFSAIPGTFLGVKPVHTSVRPSNVHNERLLAMATGCDTSAVYAWVSPSGFPIRALSFTERRAGNIREAYFEIADPSSQEGHYVRVTYTDPNGNQLIYATDDMDLPLADSAALLLHIDDMVRGLASTIPQE